MSGRDTFSQEEILAIRAQLRRLRVSERDEQKKIRAGLRRIGFRISDYATDGAGFTVSDFDSLIARGVIHKDSGTAMPLTAAPGAIAPGAAPAPKSRTRGRRAGSAAKGATGDAIAALTSPRHTIAVCLAGAVPDQPGLYAMYGNPSVWRVLGLGEPADDRPLYVGKAEDSLVARDLNVHFATGTTGRSSPRRSFAALLATELGLTAVPRRPANPEPGKWTHFSLEPAGDRKLTEWMRRHLLLAVWPLAGTGALAAIESEVMAHWQPPLNLIGVRQPWQAQVKKARAAMAAAAQAWATDHGS